MTKMSSVNKGHAWQTQRDKHNLTCLLKLRMMNFRINRIIVIVITFSVVQREYNRGDFYPCQLGYCSMRQGKLTNVSLLSWCMYGSVIHVKETPEPPPVYEERWDPGVQTIGNVRNVFLHHEKKRTRVQVRNTLPSLSPFSRIYHNKRTKKCEWLVSLSQCVHCLVRDVRIEFATIHFNQWVFLSFC